MGRIGATFVTWAIELEIPADALASVGVRQTYRNVVVGRLRRRMEQVAQRAAGNTPYPSVASKFAVTQQLEGSEYVVSVVNDSPIFPFVEDDTRRHWAPWGPGTPLAKWSEAHGITPFLVARKIAREGTKGKHMLQRAWDSSADDIGQTIDGAIAAWLDRFGNISG